MNEQTHSVRALGVSAPGAAFTSMHIERRAVGAKDVHIAIEFAGICHSDVHQARNEWFEGIFPMVPGHEIAGRVVAVGAEVTKYAVGDRVGVGVMVDSCRECEYCLEGRENFCLKGNVQTYNGRYYDGTPTLGGYSTEIVVDEHFVCRIPDALPLDGAAPLLCAGITVYTPLKNWNAGPGRRIAVLGLGGLGHLAVKIAVAMGATVTVLGRSASKRADALAFGAVDYVDTTDVSIYATYANSFDVILNTTSANLDIDRLLKLVRAGGALVTVGLPGKRESYNPFSIIDAQKAIAGSNTGGIAATQEMLDFCATHAITASIELVDGTPANIDAAYDRVVGSDVRYRFVIPTATIG